METILLYLIEKAIKLDACDVHLYERSNAVEVVYRTINGMLNEEKNYPLSLLAFLRYKANLDLSNAIKMQSGHFDLTTSKGQLPIRFSYMQTFSIKTGVLRIMQVFRQFDINSLSIHPSQNTTLKNLAKHKQGLVLFAGVMGSGKTTSIYSLLDYMISLNKNVMTLEDPIEIYKPNMVQIQVDHQNITYSEGIRQLLRHSPDIIVIGEIRDEKTAKMAVRAALSGVLVISTIHAKNANGVINRLLELGINHSDLFTTLNLIAYQRMIRNKKKDNLVIFDMLEEDEIHDIMEKNYNHIDNYQKEMDYLLKQGIITNKQFSEYQ